MEPWAAVASAIFAAVSLFSAWLSFRRNELRRDHVLAWSNEAIVALQTLLVLCIDAEPQSPELEVRLRDIRLRLSILTEQGRLFFRNTGLKNHGVDKEAAYTRLRPRILDHLIAAHQVASAWTVANPSEQQRMRLVAQDSVREFVSLAQKEVGRTRTASVDASMAGESIRLRSLLANISPDRLSSKEIQPVHPWGVIS